LLLLVLGLPPLHPPGRQPQERVDLPLAAVRVRGEEVDLEPFAQRPYPLGHTIDEPAVERQRPVDVEDRVLQGDWAPSRDVKSNHRASSRGLPLGPRLTAAPSRARGE